MISVSAEAVKSQTREAVLSLAFKILSDNRQIHIYTFKKIQIFETRMTEIYSEMILHWGTAIRTTDTEVDFFIRAFKVRWRVMLVGPGNGTSTITGTPVYCTS